MNIHIAAWASFWMLASTLPVLHPALWCAVKAAALPGNRWSWSWWLLFVGWEGYWLPYFNIVRLESLQREFQFWSFPMNMPVLPRLKSLRASLDRGWTQEDCGTGMQGRIIQVRRGLWKSPVQSPALSRVSFEIRLGYLGLYTVWPWKPF